MRLYVGFITYGQVTAKYLPYFLASLKQQTYKDYKIVAVDNSEEQDNENLFYVKKNFSEIEFKWAGKNLGFAKAFNLMIRQAVAGGAQYFLAINPDVILEPGTVEQLFKAMESDDQVAAVQPKILKWDFAHKKKTNQIDSLGLAVTKEHRFFDARQGETDDNSLRLEREVFGFTGAAALLDLKALGDVAFDNGNYKEYFDELMFMYKEDCDLSYRLRLAGWKIVFASAAVAYHNRSAASIGGGNFKIALNRRTKSRLVKQWSFLNQWILLLKFKNLPFSLSVKLATLWYQFKSLVFVLLFEQYLLKELIKLWRLRPEIKKRRERLKIGVDVKKIEKLFCKRSYE